MATAIVGIPLVIGAVVVGGWLFTAFCALLAATGAWEYARMSAHKGSGAIAAVSIPASAALVLASPLHHPAAAPGLAYAGLVAASVMASLLALMIRPRTSAVQALGATAAAIAYPGVLFLFLDAVRNMFYLAAPHTADGIRAADLSGMYLMACVFASIWACDSVAYFVGRAIGKHKIAPRLSPKKSWEGALAGLLGAAAAFAGMAQWLFPQTVSPAEGLLLGTLIGIVGPVGDFAESMLKRDAGIKDSSHLIPGHGGVLDRFDSALFAAPVVVLWFLYTL